jgi:uncharacterized protein (UPF0297 family)
MWRYIYRSKYMGKNNKPMLTVLMDSAKLQHLRDYASAHDMSMGAIVNQLVDSLLAGKPNQLPLEQNADLYIANVEKSIDKLMAKKVDDYHKSMMGMITTELLSQDKSIHSMVEYYIENNNKSIESKIAASIEINNKSIEKFVTTSIGSHLEALPPTLSRQDIDRAISSVTAKNNAELSELNKAWVEAKNEWWLSVEQVRIEHRQQIAHQHTEVDRLNKRVDELMASNIKSPTTTAIQSLNADTLSWGDFCKMIGEPLPAPKERNKATGDRIVVMASNKGFNGWRYDGKTKKFIQSSD